MLRRTLNLGILAHVDAGKTTLTERLLHAAGVIDEIGSVDDGTTQTDTLALERQRGITIKNAVVSFPLGNVTVNLIDTPGHPDFIAEVERVLGVLDGVVLVVSAVEGVQPQTRILMRAVERLRVPTLLFVNKIDRAGAAYEGLLEAISSRLTPAIVPMGGVRDLGTRGAEFAPWDAGDAAFSARLIEALAEHDDAMLAAYLDDEATVPYPRLRRELAAQAKRALLHPVFFGSALTGAGVGALGAGIAELLPAEAGDADGSLSGSVFKVERTEAGEKVAYARLFSGTVRVRDRVRFGEGAERKVTAIAVFDDGAAVHRPAASAGEIAKLWGLGEIRIGDAIGVPRANAAPRFPPPTLESVVEPIDPDDRHRLRVALAQLAEQDPLIDVRQDAALGETSISLYGEVQKEVIQATLAGDFGLEVGFRETTTICVERPTGAGEAVEVLNGETNPFNAELGLRVAPTAEGSGVAFALAVDPRSAPLYVYKNVERFADAMEEYVRNALRCGLHGWQVTDCAVTVTRCDYPLADGPPSRRGPMATAADFRKLTPLVLVRALERAGTVVCEPVVRVRLELPVGSVGAVLAALARLGAAAEAPVPDRAGSRIEATVAAARAHDLQRQLPALTGGEGVLTSEFSGYHPVAGPPPVRRRTTPDPRNREEYLPRVGRGRGSG